MGALAMVPVGDRPLNRAFRRVTEGAKPLGSRKDLAEISWSIQVERGIVSLFG